jgi:hypothetical protein
MQEDENMPEEFSDDKGDRERIKQARAQSDHEPSYASEDLKTRITEAKRRNDMIIDSALGSPSWERSVPDGHLDVLDED